MKEIEEIVDNPPEQPPELGLSEALLVSEEDKTALDKIFELLLEEKNIHHNTELTQNEILAFSVLGTLADKYDLEILKKFLKENLKLRVSKNRSGRKEWVKILGQHLRAEEVEGRSALDRFFRKR